MLFPLFWGQVKKLEIKNFFFNIKYEYSHTETSKGVLAKRLEFSYFTI